MIKERNISKEIMNSYDSQKNLREKNFIEEYTEKRIKEFLKEDKIDLPYIKKSNRKER